VCASMDGVPSRISVSSSDQHASSPTPSDAANAPPDAGAPSPSASASKSDAPMAARPTPRSGSESAAHPQTLETLMGDFTALEIRTVNYGSSLSYTGYVCVYE
jgi:hypothetical protein